MGQKWYCDQCGVDLGGKDAVPMAIGVPSPEPLVIMDPMGNQRQVVIGPNGVLMPYTKDPNALFENFQLCRTCATATALAFKIQAKRIRVTVRLAPPKDA